MTDFSRLYPCGRIARRRLLTQTAGGLLATALGSLWADDGMLGEARLPGKAPAKSRRTENQTTATKINAIELLLVAGSKALTSPRRGET